MDFASIVDWFARESMNAAEQRRPNLRDKFGAFRFDFRLREFCEASVGVGWFCCDSGQPRLIARYPPLRVVAQELVVERLTDAVHLVVRPACGNDENSASSSGRNAHL